MTKPSKKITIFLAFTPLGLLGIDKLYAATYTGNYNMFYLQFFMFFISLFRFFENDSLSRLGRAVDVLNGLFRYLSLFSLICTEIVPDIGAEELEKYLYPNVTWAETEYDWFLEAIAWVIGVASICLFFTDFILICRSWKSKREEKLNDLSKQKQSNQNAEVPPGFEDLDKKYNT
jgi:hypothetical protein